jgi:hypothetical protein
MQISEPPPTRDRPEVRAGDLVVVRRTRWRVVEVRAYEDCQVVTLRGLGPLCPGLERRVIAPFECLRRVAQQRRARLVGPVRWRRACRALVAADRPPGALGGERARIECCRTSSSRRWPSSREDHG